MTARGAQNGARVIARGARRGARVIAREVELETPKKKLDGLEAAVGG